MLIPVLDPAGVVSGAKSSSSKSSEPTVVAWSESVELSVVELSVIELSVVELSVALSSSPDFVSSWSISVV